MTWHADPGRGHAVAPAASDAGAAPSRPPGSPQIGSLHLLRQVRQRGRTLLVAVVVLASVLGAALVRPQGALPDSADSDRQRIVDGAASLLEQRHPDPGAGAHTPPSAGSAPVGPDASRATPPSVERPQTATDPAATALRGADPASALAPLRDFAHTNAKPDLATLAALSPAELEVLAGPGTASRSSAPRPEHPSAEPRVLSRIPDLIEGTPAVPRNADALAAVTVSAALRVLEEDAPIVLQDVRLGPGPARARFATRTGRGDTLSAAGWLELGDAPLPGWRIIRIQPLAVTLITPLGNPVRLAAAGGPAR